jgi:hypothetical protein
MSEFFEPLLVKLPDINKKRLIADEYEETKRLQSAQKYFKNKNSLP